MVYEIVARHIITKKWATLYYNSIKDAKKENKHLNEFRLVRVHKTKGKKEKQQKLEIVD